jgi:photosystem II stability/assembly factor-like uncharacterized protein
MISKLKFIYLVLAAGVFVLSCSKHNKPPATAPELLDTLGAGWQRIKIDTTLNFEDIFFVNNQTGFLCGDKYLGKSVDGGLTWKRIIPDSLNTNFVNLFFADANNGWAFGGPSYYLRTRDGGTSWQKINRGDVYEGQFLDADNGYFIAGTNGTPWGLYKTSDGGITSQYMNTGMGTGLFFLNQNEGWFSGSSYLSKTENAGLSFSQRSGTSGGMYAVQFTDALHGWVAGTTKVYRTVDGGATLETMINNGAISGGDIQFFDNNNGFVLGGGKIYSTADGGKTINQLCAIHKSQLYEIHFTDMNHGWTAGQGGYVYRYVRP